MQGIKIWSILILIVMLGLVTYFGFQQWSTEMGLLIVAYSVAIAFLNLDKFDTIKAGNFEAKMKKAQETVDRAQATLQDLRTLAAGLAEISLNNLARQNRIIKNDPKFKIEQRDRITNILKDLKEDEEVIQKSTKKFNNFILLDHANQILKVVEVNNQSSTKSKLYELIDLETIENLDPSEIETIIKNGEGRELTEKEKTALEDWKFFKNNKQLRRPEDIFVDWNS
jgi:hypothetical protein